MTDFINSAREKIHEFGSQVDVFFGKNYKELPKGVLDSAASSFATTSFIAGVLTLGNLPKAFAYGAFSLTASLIYSLVTPFFANNEKDEGKPMTLDSYFVRVLVSSTLSSLLIFRDPSYIIIPTILNIVTLLFGNFKSIRMNESPFFVGGFSSHHWFNA